MISDIALDRKLDAIENTRRLVKGAADSPNARFLKALSHVLQRAAPFYWNSIAFEANGRAMESFPEDGVILPGDLVEPAQWWYFDCPTWFDKRPEGAIDDGPNFPDEIPDDLGPSLSRSALLVSVGEPFGLDGFVVVDFRRYKPWQYLGGPFPIGYAHWPVGSSHFDAFIDDLDTFDDGPMREDQRRSVGCASHFAVSGLLWLRSTVPIVDRQQPSRHARKRAERAAVPSPDSIRVVTLRASDHVAPMTESERREWSCRWLVRGHWRNQFLPSMRSHRPTFIDQHVKGPSDKPVRTHEGVRYNVTR